MSQSRPGRVFSQFSTTSGSQLGTPAYQAARYQVMRMQMMVAAALTGWLPGPGGIPLFLMGLAVWASEFEWAHRLLSVFDRW
ncbi:MAG TPA: PGPGW domain-containing protein, partial [Candidatus Luteococcus avicola]|nr:PGPGW domain-containing protein [Candidatus Luteococcus avicola]